MTKNLNMDSKSINLISADIKHEIQSKKKNLNYKNNKSKKKKSEKKDLEYTNTCENNKFENENEHENEYKDKNEHKYEIKIEYKDQLEDSESEDERSEVEDLQENYSDATYLARHIASKEKPSFAEQVKLYNLCIKLRHEVPPQHKIETRAGSHVPTKEELQKFKEIALCRKGVYSCDEDDIIVHNWKAFCEIHGWIVTHVTPFLYLRVGTEPYIRSPIERRKFVQFLADGLPNRTLYSVYHRFKTLYRNNINRRYTREEDEMIIDHLEDNPYLNEKCKFVDLAKALKRTRHSIYRRYRLLQRDKRKLM
ncbi:hypothetical protein HN011_000007 [Eciton burchellii]|nr:hypothetical protein HN011_000007 [Eciton burchellii]